MSKFILRFKNDGNVTIKVEDCDDETCIQKTKIFEEAVGLVEHREMTIETDPLAVQEKVEEQENVSEF